MGALHTAVVSGRALYAGISSYSPERTRQAAVILADMGTPLLIHQPSYSMFNRRIEGGLLDTLGELGIGCIAFSPLAQGMLTNRYLGGVPDDSRAARQGSFSKDLLTDTALEHIRALADIAANRGQTLAQMALPWALRDSRITSVLVGASSVKQLEDNIGAVDGAAFGHDELQIIEHHAAESEIDTWNRTAKRGSEVNAC